MDFKPASEVINSSPISLYIKKMTGEIVEIKYDDEESLERLIERELLNGDEYNGYMFNLFREEENNDNDEIKKIDEDELKDGDNLCIVLYPKTFDINFIFIEDSLLYKSEEFEETQREICHKFIISIRQNNNKLYSQDHLEFCFYYKRDYRENRENIYIPAYSAKLLINEYNTYIEEDRICIKGEIFTSFKDMIKDFLSNTYTEYICDTIIEESVKLWKIEA
jgi:hypothetical protein